MAICVEFDLKCPLTKTTKTIKDKKMTITRERVKKLEILKLNFANRILSNSLTSQILNYTLTSEKKNKFVNEINEIMGKNKRRNRYRPDERKN